MDWLDLPTVWAMRRPPVLKPVPKDEWPEWARRLDLLEHFHSRDFELSVRRHHGSVCMMINRTQVDHKTGRHRDGITWDEIQRLKSEAGYGGFYAFEVFPPDARVFNEGNVRHIWLAGGETSIGVMMGLTGGPDGPEELAKLRAEAESAP